MTARLSRDVKAAECPPCNVNIPEEHTSNNIKNTSFQDL